MTTPIWCKGCGDSLGDKWEAWSEMRPQNDHQSLNDQGRKAADVLSAINVHHKCCRVVLLTTNDLLPILNKYERPKVHQQE